MNPPENHGLDIVIGGVGLSSLGWWALLHRGDEVAASIAAWGGAVLIVLRLFFYLKDRYWSRRK